MVRIADVLRASYKSLTPNKTNTSTTNTNRYPPVGFQPQIEPIYYRHTPLGALGCRYKKGPTVILFFRVRSIASIASETQGKVKVSKAVKHATKTAEKRKPRDGMGREVRLRPVAFFLGAMGRKSRGLADPTLSQSCDHSEIT